MYPVNGVSAVPSVLLTGGVQLRVAVPVVPGVTLTVVLCEAEPPEPLHVSV